MPGQPGYDGPPPQGFPPQGFPPQPGYGAPPPGFSGPGQPGFGAPPPGYLGGPGVPPKKKSRAGLIIGIVVVLLIIIIGGIVAVALLGGKKNSGPTSNATATVAATATPVATATPSIPAGFQQFTSPDNTFSIVYPSDWTKDSSSEGTGAQFVGTAGQIFIVTNGGAGQGDPATNDAAFCGALGGPPSAPKQVTISGQQWTQEECDNSSGTQHAAVDSVSYKGNLYLIAYASPKATYASDNTKYYQPMEQSFQFLS
jgi:hypothetical protein